MKPLYKRIPACLLTMLIGLLSVMAQAANWTIDSKWSHIYFMSYKNIDIAESHLFTNIRGQVTNSGEALINIDLGSVDTRIPIRDQRMKEMLFETKEYPTATIKAQMDSSWLKQVQQGEPKTTQVNALLSLHGQERPIELSIIATKTQKGTIQVTSLKPIIINAESWDLDTGINKLKNVAGLDSIGLSIPVGFTLNFYETL